MVKPGRIPERERSRAISGIIHALENNSEGLGVRELRKASGIKSNETLYKYLPHLFDEKVVDFSEVSVGRGMPKKVYKLTKKGIAFSVEFKIMEHFEKIRNSCKESEQFEIDNYAFCYAIYGMPKNLDRAEKKQVQKILRRLNLALLDLENLRDRAINKEAYKYRRLVSKIFDKISQYISDQNIHQESFSVDRELIKEIFSYVPPSVKNKMKLDVKEDFALLVTRGPAFIEEYSLRPENHLLDLVQSVEKWDEDGIASVVNQLAKNIYVNQEAINRIKKWDNPDGRISNFYWQQIKDRLDDIPKIRKKMRKNKQQLIKSGDFKRVLGLKEGTSLVVTKEMLGKEKLDELRKELSGLDHVQELSNKKGKHKSSTGR